MEERVHGLEKRMDRIEQALEDVSKALNTLADIQKDYGAIMAMVRNTQKDQDELGHDLRKVYPRLNTAEQTIAVHSSILKNLEGVPIQQARQGQNIHLLIAGASLITSGIVGFLVVRLMAIVSAGG